MSIYLRQQICRHPRSVLPRATVLPRNPHLYKPSIPSHHLNHPPIRWTFDISPPSSTSTSTRTDLPSLLNAPQPQPQPLPYTPPTTGLLSHLPRPWIPYAELIRLDKPTGAYYLYFPCLWSTLLAAPLTHPITPAGAVLSTSLLFLAGALIMRSAGCVINDLWDRRFDAQVARTRHRPLARGAIAPRSALIFTATQLLAGLAVLLQFPSQCFYYAVPSLALVATYPLAKRVTHYPQVVLGLTFSWGAIMGFPALGVDLVGGAEGVAGAAAACLYASNVAWTVLYDMVYAHMDVRDDAKAGVKSMVVRYEAHTKKIMAGLAALQVVLLAAAGVAAGSGPVFFVVGCGSAVASLGVMIRRVQLGSVRDCWWWFRYGCLLTGGGIACGLAGDYVARLRGWYDGTTGGLEGSEGDGAAGGD
ncbi:MAG: Para-hydroxybenzoate--polyprenyltransferase, mitochondrial precursor (PHB:polyprenyltransferase) [Peltula sp. TS41687]|nr:MAG: Para-hydroxybenzoate--polyprenyltransferase, mitochondrial precursor (PHB:polyprenyltransferase) [Peltula sp. TS41687]